MKIPKLPYLIAAVAILVLLMIFPFIAITYWVHLAIITFFYVILAASWDSLAGYTGQVSFGHAAFAAIGAYVSAILAIDAGVPPPVAVILGAGASCLVSAALGSICIKMSGSYLALTTLGFSELVRLVLINERQWTRGPMGLHVLPLYEGQNILNFYFVMMAITIVSIIVMYKMLYSPRGLIFKSLLNDELAASVLGVNVVRQRLYAFSFAGFFAGLAGALYASYIVVITPSLGSLLETFNAISMTVIGGFGTLIGPIIGAPLLYISAEWLRDYGTYRYLIDGLLVVLMIRFAPEGLVGIARRIWRNIRGK
jgi:branched-chain amino acid transport system permease protein